MAIVFVTDGDGPEYPQLRIETDLHGHTENIDDYVVPFGDVDTLTDALHNLLIDVNQAKRDWEAEHGVDL